MIQFVQRLIDRLALEKYATSLFDPFEVRFQKCICDLLYDCVGKMLGRCQRSLAVDGLAWYTKPEIRH